MVGFDDASVSTEEVGTVEESEATGAAADADDHASPSPFESSASPPAAEPIDSGADTMGIFTSSNDGPLLPDPSRMQEESSAFREWRR